MPALSQCENAFREAVGDFLALSIPFRRFMFTSADAYNAYVLVLGKGRWRFFGDVFVSQPRPDAPKVLRMVKQHDMRNGRDETIEGIHDKWECFTRFMHSLCLPIGQLKEGIWIGEPVCEATSLHKYFAGV